MKKDYYEYLGISKWASDAEIKKAYKKKAMQYHPDRNKGDKTAEKKFKEINEAYQVLWDAQKRKNYDQFWNAEGNPFGGAGGNPFWGSGYRSSTGSFGWFEDIFSQFDTTGWGGFEFDLWDIFSGAGTKNQKSRKEKPHKEDTPSLDIVERVEIPFLDFLFDTSVSVKTVYGKNLSLKVKAGTKPGTRFKISGKWRTIEGKTWDMYVIVDAKMPKTPLDTPVEKMIEAIRYQI